MKRGKGESSKTTRGVDRNRRRILAGLAAAPAAAALSSCGSDSAATSSVIASLPDPAMSGIDHIVVVMMENRSFDHYLGWLPGADGKQAGLSYPDVNGALQSTYPLAPEFQSCGKQDPDHSHEGGVKQYNNGACDGFLQTSPTDTFPIGYFTQADLSFTGQAAPAWTVYDRYFCSILAETYPNRFYMHGAQTPQIHNDTTAALTNPATIPTIWDRLRAAGRTGTYYFSDVPFVGLWGSTYLSIAQPYEKFLVDCALGNLPDVSYIDPAFEDEGSGTSRDDHPFADIRDGQAFLSQIYNAVTSSPQWEKTALFITYDEWGGFFDHVPPPDAGFIPPADLAACQAENVVPFSRMGFRVPTMLISPRARRGHVSHEQYDHCSILKMIEWRFGLPPLTLRDAQANNIANSFDFVSPPDLTLPTFNAVPLGPFGLPCALSSLPLGSNAAAIREKHFAEVNGLKALARQYGFAVR
ncbi:MAG TPA: alkaline phosphatase family protein [Nevskiaceae bacterium]|nr:alkaline phosphatase family protein [Nevskiaceae bacterium]